MLDRLNFENVFSHLCQQFDYFCLLNSELSFYYKTTNLEYGLCHLGLIPLRKEYDHKSEMVSQLLYGDCYKIIDKRKKWFKIRMEWDGYEGWIISNQ